MSNIIAIEDRVLSMGQVSFIVLFDIMVGRLLYVTPMFKILLQFSSWMKRYCVLEEWESMF